MNQKTVKIILWTAIALLALQFTAAGLGKFTGDWNAKFIQWGYPLFFVYAVGVVEIGGMIGLFIGKVRKWAALLLIVTMLGAAVTHLMNDEFPKLIHNGVLIGLLYLVYWLDRKREVPQG